MKKTDKIGFLATTNNKKELRNLIFEDYPALKGIEKNFFDCVHPKDIAEQYNDILIKWGENEDFKKLAKLVPNGMGEFEVLLSFLGDNITINGTRKSYDIDSGDFKIEVKKVKKGAKGLYNFRLGTASMEQIKKSMSDIWNLIYAVKRSADDFEEIKDAFNRGEVKTSLINQLRDIDKETLLVLESSSEFVITDKLNVYQNSKKIGFLYDKKTVNKLAKLALKTPLKLVNKIEKELSKDFSKCEYSYFFFVDIESNIEPGKLYYKERLDDVKIEKITQNRIKIFIEV